MRTPSFISKLLAILLLLGLAPLAHAQNNSVPLEPTIEDPDAIIDLIVVTDETAIQVLELLEQLTGKIILRRQDIPATKFNFFSLIELKLCKFFW